MTFLITSKLCKNVLSEATKNTFLTEHNCHNEMSEDHQHLERNYAGLWVLGKDKRSESRRIHKEHIYETSGEALLRL